ncbi:MAG: tetratricopeptide repeat protein, partial [Planctomycetota bacterium]|nr:tetratricopeptide repeat protein [Planctomycetota bacterium]
APYLTVTPSLVPTFAALIKHESPPTGAEPLGGDALQAVGVHLMRALAVEKPTIWVMDDVQFAPPESRALILAMARAVEDQRILLVAAARPGLDNADFSRLNNFRRLDIGRLSPREVVHLLEQAFQSDVLADKLGVKIAVKSDGVPFFIFEIIRGLKEGQFITQQDDGGYVQTQMISAIEVPSAVKDLIEQRMRDLTPAHRAILDVGAVQGPEFDPDLVARVREMKRVQVLETLADIERRTGIVRASGRAYRFDQNQIHEVVLSGVSEALREEYHTLLADAFAERKGVTADAAAEISGEVAYFLAGHHLHGTRPKAGIPFLTRALEHLSEGHRRTAAIELADRALGERGLLEALERGEILLSRALEVRSLGLYEEERKTLDEALQLADAEGELAFKCKVGERLGWHLYARSQYDQGYDWLLDLWALGRQAGARREEAVILGHLGALCERTGRYEEALEHHEAARRIGEDIGDDRIVNRAQVCKGVVLNQLSRLDEAKELLETALASAPDAHSRANVVGNLGDTLFGMGRFDDAREQFERSVALFREVGYLMYEAVYTLNLGGAFNALGHYDKSRRCYERSVAGLQESGHRDGETRALVGLGVLLVAAGDLGQGVEVLENALAKVRSIGIQPVEARAQRGLGAAAAADGRLSDAESFIEQALSLQRALKSPGAAMETLMDLAKLRLAQDRTEEAQGLLEEALTTSSELGIADPAIPAQVFLAWLRQRDVESARQAFADGWSRLSVAAAMECSFVLWKSTEDKEYLTEAHRLLMHLRDHAPEDCRDSVIENVPLHRDIMKAWEEHGEKG